MDSDVELKEINIENPACYFNGIVKIAEFNLDNILIF